MNAFGKVTKLVVASLTVATYVAASNVEAPMKPVCSASVPSTTPVKEGAKTESNLKGATTDSPKEEEKKTEVKASTGGFNWRVSDRIVSYLGASKLPKKFQSVYDDLHNNGGITIPGDLMNKINGLSSGPLPVDILEELSDKIGSALSSKYKVSSNDMKSYVFNALRSPGILEV
ncbi:uncharacterized protein BBOV_IV000765 [Babesia bovis T2Bo]|uniref:uncharacterized protein n=1 Tax=Babesia bovis T2Bo TaxID=484906 RepID=UPI001D99E5D1|nr:uncharacterized protein BBOV_IV000765 [Babesia bovis T2Bo]KAG6439890.1 hypothetical protein BBOV_IV000765 [Babesia bovis T2Bo]